MDKNNIKGRSKGKQDKKAGDMAWDLFSQSGNIAHYLLYKQLEKDKT